MLSKLIRHTSDSTSNHEIARRVRERNNGRVLIHNVAFGSGADYEFMQQISAENEGIDRRIFENLDAAASVSFTNTDLSNPIIRIGSDFSDYYFYRFCRSL